MRVTSHHLIDLAAAATQRTQEQVADATQVASSGLQIAEPSDDVAKWVAAARDRVRQAISSGTGDAIGAGLDRLQQTDGALQNLSTAVSQARTLAVQGASDGMNASDRTRLAEQAKQLNSAALAAANTQAPDGTYLLSGSQSQTAPFDASGAYQGDTNADAIASSDGSRHTVAVTGSTCSTASHGVDVLEVIANLGQALDANDTAGIQTAIGDLSTAVDAARRRARHRRRRAELADRGEQRTHPGRAAADRDRIAARRRRRRRCREQARAGDPARSASRRR